MRDKYGIQKKNTGGRPKTEVLEEIKKDYGMNDKDARALQQKISEVFLHFVYFISINFIRVLGCCSTRSC